MAEINKKIVKHTEQVAYQVNKLNSECVLSIYVTPNINKIPNINTVLIRISFGISIWLLLSST